jgi:Bacteriophage clamp loader A subunit
MPDLFKEIIPSILQTKQDPFEGNYVDYNPFIVNRALSYHLDCLPYVAEISALSFLEKDMQYQYLLHSIRSMKRPFHKWQKFEKSDDIECVKKYFGYSYKKAKEVIDILNPEQIDFIRKKTELGGIKK